MEEVFDDERFPNDCLTKVILKRSRIFGFRESILSYGVCESVVFPDLEGGSRNMILKNGFRRAIAKAT